jgi:hypothetical protein
MIESLPSREETVDEEQIFILGLDAPVDPQTVVQYAYCDARGIAEKIPVRVVSGEQRILLLEQRRDFLDRYLAALYKDGRLAAIAQRDLLRGTRAEQLQQADEAKVSGSAVAMRAASAERCAAAPDLGQGHRVAQRREDFRGSDTGVQGSPRVHRGIFL